MGRRGYKSGGNILFYFVDKIGAKRALLFRGRLE